MPLHTTPIRRFEAGRTPLTALRLNEVGEQLSRVARDERHQDLSYEVITRGGTAPAATLALAKITGHAGTEAPYLYSGAPVRYNDSGDLTHSDWVLRESEDNLTWSLINLNEIGPGGVGVAPIANNTPVMYFSMGAYFGFVALQSRGVYP